MAAPGQYYCASRITRAPQGGTRNTPLWYKKVKFLYYCIQQANRDQRDREIKVTSKTFLTGLLILLASLSLPAQAQRKTDIITLYNGDRMTGEIKSLFGGILELSTHAMGRIKIEWPEISQIESQYHYEVRLSDGDRHYGSFHDSARPGQIVLVDLYEQHDFDWLQVVEIRPVKESFAERLEVYLSAGYSYTRASGVAQVSFNTTISYEDENTRNTLTARTDLTETDESSTSSTRVDLNRSVWQENRSDAFRSIFANYEDSDELELDYRIGAGAGRGRFFMDTHRARLAGVAGLQVITEAPLDGGGSNQDIELFLNANFAAWKFTTPELDVDLSFSLYPSLTDSGRVRSDSSLRLRWELIEDLYWDITAWAATDNDSESDDGNSVDYSVTTGIGWEY